MQATTCQEQSRGATEEEDRRRWAAVVAQMCPDAANDSIESQFETKPCRMLLLCSAHLIYIKWHGLGHRKNRVRWVLHLEHIASITSVAQTLVIAHNTPLQLGALRLEVPRRRYLASAQDTMADLLLHKVNGVLDSYFKTKLMQGRAAAPLSETGGTLTVRGCRPALVATCSWTDIGMDGQWTQLCSASRRPLLLR